MLAFATRAVLIVLAAVMYFLPWHTAAGLVCTGFSHFRGHPALPMLLAAVAAFVVVDRKGGPPEVRIPFCIGRIGFAMVLVFLALQEGRAAHAYNRIEGELVSARLFYIALGALIVLDIAAFARALVQILRRAPGDGSA